MDHVALVDLDHVHLVRVDRMALVSWHLEADRLFWWLAAISSGWCLCASLFLAVGGRDGCGGIR